MHASLTEFSFHPAQDVALGATVVCFIGTSV